MMNNSSESSRISVIIPVYNGDKYLREAINTVLLQKHLVYELIIVDDGSTDRTQDIITEFGNRVINISKEHTGLGDTMNRGIAEAKGEYMAFLDADDLWMDNKLELQSAAFRGHDVDMVFGYMQQFISPELDEEARSSIQCPDQPVPGYSSDTILVRKEVFHQAGVFSTDYQVGEFIDWYLRTESMGLKSIMLPEVLVKRRLHKTNMTGQDNKKDYVRILKANLDRRRNSKR